MEQFIVNKDALAYNLIGKGLENHELVPSNGIFMQEGRKFNGALVFLRMPYGFKPMIKVIDNKLKNNYYYFLEEVTPVNSEKTSGFDANFIHAERNPNLRHYAYANPNTYSALMTYKEEYPQYSSANANDLADIKELTPAELQNVHQNSGTKMNFMDWLNSPQGKDTVNNVSALAFSLINNQQGGAAPKPTAEPTKVNEDDKDAEFRILWMHPLTFAAVSIVAIVGGIIVFSVIKNKNK